MVCWKYFIFIIFCRLHFSNSWGSLYSWGKKAEALFFLSIQHLIWTNSCIKQHLIIESFTFLWNHRQGHGRDRNTPQMSNSHRVMWQRFFYSMRSSDDLFFWTTCDGWKLSVVVQLSCVAKSTIAEVISFVNVLGLRLDCPLISLLPILSYLLSYSYLFRRLLF